MNCADTIFGLPLQTFYIGGGLFILSTFLPTIIMLVLEYRKEKSHE